LADVEQVLRRLTMQTAVHHDIELVHDSLWYIEPMQLSVKKPRQASLELLCASDHSSRSVQHSLQLVCRRFRRTRQDSITAIDAQSDVRETAHSDVTLKRHVSHQRLADESMNDEQRTQTDRPGVYPQSLHRIYSELVNVFHPGVTRWQQQV